MIPSRDCGRASRSPQAPASRRAALAATLVGLAYFTPASAAVDPTREGHPASEAFNHFPVADNLPLFHPLEIAGRRVSLWNREYLLNSIGLLQSLKNGGRTATESPMVLEGKLDGEDLALTPVGQNISESSPNRVVFVTQSRHGPTIVTITTAIESDGMIRFVIDADASDETTFEDIRIRLPLDGASFQYLHYVAETKTKCDTLSLPDAEGLIWGSDDARTLFLTTKLSRKTDVDGFKQNANIANSFLPLVWIGNGSAGLAWFAESDEGWQDTPGKSIVELKRTNRALELIVNFVMGPARRKSLHLDFGLQATPVKPLPAGWREWQQYNGQRLFSRATPDFEYFDGRIPQGSDKVIVFSLDFIGFDTPHRFSRMIQNPEKSRDIIRQLKERRCKVFAYMTPSRVSHTQNLPSQWEEWTLIPKRVLHWKPHPGSPAVEQVFLCHNAPGNYLHLLEYAERLVRDYDIDGVYVDVPLLNTGCMAPGCSCNRADGARQPAFKIYLMREFYRKLAGIFVRHGKYPYVLVHNSTQFMIPAFSFCWAGKPGEFMAEINYEQNHIEYFRGHRAKAIVEFNPRPWGLVPFCMDDIKFSRYGTLNSKPSFSGKAAFEENWKRRYLGVPLLHDGLIMNWCSTPDFSVPIYRARKEFGIGEEDVKFHAYWDADALKTDNPNVAISHYTREHAIMLVLVNFSDADTACTIDLPPPILSKIGPEGLIDPISRQTIPVRDARILVPVPAQQHRILRGMSIP